MLIALIVLGILVLAMLGVLIFVLRKNSAGGESQSALLLKADMTELTKGMQELKDGLQRQLTEQLGTSNKQLASQSAASIRILQQVTEKLTKLEGTNKNVGDIAAELKTLQNVLQNPKQRGVIGEY